MKHLIIFLNYNQSRIQNPVYRQFANTPLASRNATLLFLSKPLDERELMYEVGLLRRKDDTPSPVTFHICVTLDHPEVGLLVSQTLTLIRRQFADSPLLAYCLLPDLKTCTDEKRNAAWKSLVAINNTATDYQDIDFLRTCFLYTDETQSSLAHFLYDYTQYPEVQDKLPQHVALEEKTEFPPVFSTFSAMGISYPEEDIRFHLHQQYLYSLLSYSQPDVNPVSIETCNEMATDLLCALPLSLEKVCLQDAEFIDLNPDAHKQHEDIATYWDTAMELANTGLKDMPREDWLRELQTRLEVLFQRRFRDTGVDFYYEYEQKKTADYNRVLLAGVSQQLEQTMLSHPYPPETLKDIVRSVVNQLQQRVLQIEQSQQQAQIQIGHLKESISAHINQWNKMGIFDRMRGKDTELLQVFKNDLLQFFRLRTLIPGCKFASKLLNELIPQVAGLSEGSDHVTAVCRECLHSISKHLEESDPAPLCTFFPAEPIVQAREVIRLDREHLLQQYQRLLPVFYGRNTLIDGEDLLQRVRTILADDINRYLSTNIYNGILPSVLNLPITDRLAAMYEGHGGLSRFVYELKMTTAISLLLKNDSGSDVTTSEENALDQYVLISPVHTDLRESITSHNNSDLQMLHLKFGISLTDLDGFSGQRMFVEPSIF